MSDWKSLCCEERGMGSEKLRVCLIEAREASQTKSKGIKPAVDTILTEHKQKHGFGAWMLSFKG